MFSVLFLVAEVLSVSTVAVRGARSGDGGFTVACMAVAVAVVALPPRRCALCAKKFAPLGLLWA